MESIERLAIAQAVYKAVADVVSTKNPDSLRSQADRELRDMYDSMGVKSLDLKLEGQKVGTYSVTMAKATEEKHSRFLKVTDPAKVQAWAEENETEFREWLSGAWEAFADYCFETYGEVPEGTEVVDHMIPALPEHVKGTTLRVDPAKVAKALQGQLPAYVAGLLEGGEE